LRFLRATLAPHWLTQIHLVRLGGRARTRTDTAADQSARDCADTGTGNAKLFRFRRGHYTNCGVS